MNVRAGERNSRDAIREVSRPTISSSSKLLFNPVYTLDITETSRIISRFVDDTTIVYAAVYQTDGQKISEVGTEWLPPQDIVSTLSANVAKTNAPLEQVLDDHYLLIVTPISIGTNVIGTVTYAFDQSVLQEGLQKGLQEGIVLGLEKGIMAMYRFEKNPEKIAEFLDEDKDLVYQIFDKLKNEKKI